MDLDELFEMVWKMVRSVDTSVSNVEVITGQVRAWVEAVDWTQNVLLDWLLHFVYSGSLGLLVYWVTLSVTQWVCGSLVFPSQSKLSWQGVLERDIWRLAICSGLFASWLGHLWWDGLLT